MNHLFALFETYSPNTAPTNRMLSYLEVWAKLDIKVTVAFVQPDRHFSHISKDYDNIEFWYVWEDVPIKSYLLHKMLLYWHIRKILNRISQGDFVYVYGQAYALHRILSQGKRIKVYQERTEHPMVYKLGYRPYRVSLSTYLEDCKKVDGLFVISQALKDYYISVGVDTGRVWIVNMTVDASRFVSITKRKQEDRYIAYCGKASNNKDGVDQLIKAFALVHKKYPNLSLYVIGQAPKRQELNSTAILASELGVSNCVRFTGAISYTDIPGMLTDADILVLARPNNMQAQYGFPTKLGEYLLTGNPVVVTRVGDIPQYIEDGVSGMVAEPSSPEDFASKIIWLLDHPDKARKIGENGKQVALKYFNNEVEARKIITIIFNQSTTIND